MDFSVGQVLVEIGKQSWGIALCSGLFGSIVGGLISGLITRYVTIKTNEENVKHSQRNYIYKQKVELIIKTLQAILKTSGNVMSIIKNQRKNKRIQYSDEYLVNIENLTDLSFQLQVIADLYPDMQDIATDIQDFYLECGSFINYFEHIQNYVVKKNCKTIDLLKMTEFQKSSISRKNGTVEIIFGNLDGIIEILEQFEKDMDKISNILTENLQKNIK